MKQTLLRYLPNVITSLRLLAVMPVGYLLLQQEYGYGLFLFAMAGVSDGIDGYLARRFHWESHWGAIMDPLADKLLMFVTATVLMLQMLLPFWLFVLIILRDTIIVVGASAYRYQFGPFKVSPTVLGKLSTFVQILLILSLLLHSATGLMSHKQLFIITHICALVTILSGVQYITIWIRKALNE